MRSTASTKKLIYRVGCKVKVVNPSVVIRVGYPLTLEDGMIAAEQKYGKDVSEFMRSVGAVDANFTATDVYDSRLYNDVMAALAGYHLRSVSFGGRERSVHTELDEPLRNTSPWEVVSKRVVKTGTYNSGGISHGYNGDGDYEPPHLSNEKSNVLLTIAPLFLTGHLQTEIEIEAVNVRLVDGV